MTVLYLGDREDILAQKSWDVVQDYQVETFRRGWTQTRLAPLKRLVLNPPKEAIFSTLIPDPLQDLGWTGKDIPPAWKDWAAPYKLDTFKPGRLTLAQVRKDLKGGIRWLQFSPGAIEWFTYNLHSKHLSRTHISNLCLLLLVSYPKPQQLEADDVARVLGGAEQQIPAKLLRYLGTAGAVRLCRQIPSSNDAYRLFNYLTLAMTSMNSPWLLLLHTCKKGADDNRYDYRVAIVIFALCCLKTSKGTRTSFNSPASTEQILDLYRLSGIAS